MQSSTKAFLLSLSFPFALFATVIVPDQDTSLTHALSIDTLVYINSAHLVQPVVTVASGKHTIAGMGLHDTIYGCITASNCTLTIRNLAIAGPPGPDASLMYVCLSGQCSDIGPPGKNGQTALNASGSGIYLDHCALIGGIGGKGGVITLSPGCGTVCACGLSGNGGQAFTLEHSRMDLNGCIIQGGPGGPANVWCPSSSGAAGIGGSLTDSSDLSCGDDSRMNLIQKDATSRVLYRLQVAQPPHVSGIDMKGNRRTTVFDCRGKQVNGSNLRPGVYFFKSNETLKRIIMK
jgi:hypothetical protein